MVPYTGQTAEKDYRPAQLSEDPKGQRSWCLTYLEYAICTLEYFFSNNRMVNEWLLVQFLFLETRLELSTHKNNLWVAQGNHGVMYWKDGRKVL